MRRRSRVFLCTNAVPDGTDASYRDAPEESETGVRSCPMLHATELLGAKTYDSYGHFVGRVKEMFIVPAEQPNRVARLMLSRGKYRPLVARYDQIESVAPGKVTLST